VQNTRINESWHTSKTAAQRAGATRCNTLQHTATHWCAKHTYQWVMAHLQNSCTTCWCNTLQHTATHCNTLMCKTHVSMSHGTPPKQLHHALIYGLDQGLKKKLFWSKYIVGYDNTTTLIEVPIQVHTATHCNALQYITTRCNTLQHAATHCSTLQHTVAHCSTL